MWQRQFFFWMEELQITAGERRVILLLISANLIISGFTYVMPSRTVYDISYYEPVIAEFKRLSGIEERERQLVLAQYFPLRNRQVFEKAVQQSGAVVPSEPVVTINPEFQRLQNEELASANFSHRNATSDDGIKEELDSEGSAGYDRDDAGDQTEPVNIQSAEADELTRLPGIGPVTAERIVSYRNKNGHFSGPDDLLNVSGIGPVTLENIREYIVFDIKEKPD